MPEGEKPVIPPPPAIHIERTLALIKPDAIHKSDEIEEIIIQHGFTILQVRKTYYLSSVLFLLSRPKASLFALRFILALK